MKKNDLQEMKSLDVKTIFERAKKVRREIDEVIMDKNMGKIKDLKTISKKKKDLAQMMTVLRQKELLAQLESGVEILGSSKEIKDDKSKIKNEKGAQSSL